MLEFLDLGGLIDVYNLFSDITNMNSVGDLSGHLPRRTQGVFYLMRLV
jgi:hypothetical protein